MSKGATVSIVRIDNSVEVAVEEAVNLVGGLSAMVSPGDTVLIKPNCIREEPSYMGTTTNIQVIKAAVRLVKEAGAIPIVGEASGNQYDTEAVFKNLGLREALGDVKVLDLDKEEIVNVNIKGAKALKRVGIAKAVLEADFIIGLPLLKTHMTTMITIGMKNMMGVLPQREKWNMHLSGLHQALVDLNRIVKPDLVIVDGVTGMEGLGPTIGTPVQMELILAGKDVVAVDSVGSAVMGFVPEEIEHLVRAGNDGLGVNDLQQIEVLGEQIEDVARAFKRPFNNKPLGPKFMTVWANFQYKLGTFLLNQFGYDFRPILKDFSNIYVAKPKLQKDFCNGCNECVIVCKTQAIKMMAKHPAIDYDACSKCLRCVRVCPNEALTFSRKPGWMLKMLHLLAG